MSEATETNEKRYRRSNTVSSLKRKNLKLLNGLREHEQTNEPTDEQQPHVKRLKKAIGSCCGISLYGENLDTVSLEYIASHTCDNKFCFVCNWGRQRAIRKKYVRFFESNKTVVKMERSTKKGTQTRYCTNAGEKDLLLSGWTATADYSFDLMHLTLTVPHTAEGYKNQKFYFEAVKTDFEHLRRADFWADFVLGGEFGCEFTRGEHGLHIHIHCLLLVRKPAFAGERTRNELYRHILLYWNSRTAWDGSKRTAFSEAEKAAILKGNEKILTTQDIAQLNPQGSTFVDLSNIFAVGRNGKKKYVSNWDHEWTEGNRVAVVKAVMETISYHFKPQCFDSESGEFYYDTLIETLPALFKKSLYGKFGALATEKTLNISYKLSKEDYAQAAKEKAALNELAAPADRRFFVMDASHCYHPPDNDYKPVLSNTGLRKRRYLGAFTGPDAFDEMGELVKLQTQNGVNVYENV